MGQSMAMTSFPSSTPTAWGHQIHEWILDTPAQLRELRAALHTALTGSPEFDGRLEDVPEKMLLVATELATNALRHGRPPTSVRLYEVDDEGYILDVADHDPQILPEFADFRPPGGGGLGLRLAEEFSLDIGWFVNGPTKHIWARFPRVAA